MTHSFPPRRSSDLNRRRRPNHPVGAAPAARRCGGRRVPGRGGLARGSRLSSRFFGPLEQIRVGWNRQRRSTDPVNLLYPFEVGRIPVVSWNQIGRASGGEGVCLYGETSGGAVSI